MKLIAYPESKLEPRKIVVLESDKTNKVICYIYADGCVSPTGRLIFPEELKVINLVKDNFFLFYDNVENVNPRL